MLAQREGWKAYVWHRAKELEANDSGLWIGLADALKAAVLTGRGEALESEVQPRMRPR